MGQQLKLHGKNVLIPVIRIQATFALRIPCYNPGNIPIIREPASAKIPGKNISVLTVCICSGPERYGLLTLIHERTLSRADCAHFSVLRTIDPHHPRACNRLRRNGRLRGSTAYSTSPFAKAIFIESTVYIMYIVINYDSLIWHQWIEHWKVWGWLAILSDSLMSSN